MAVLERRGGDVVGYGMLREVGLWWVRAWLMDVACLCVKLLGARLWRKVDLLVPLGLVELLSKVVVQRQLVGSAGVAGAGSVKIRSEVGEGVIGLSCNVLIGGLMMMRKGRLGEVGCSLVGGRISVAVLVGEKLMLRIWMEAGRVGLERGVVWLGRVRVLVVVGSTGHGS